MTRPTSDTFPVNYSSNINYSTENNNKVGRLLITKTEENEIKQLKVDLVDKYDKTDSPYKAVAVKTAESFNVFYKLLIDLGWSKTWVKMTYTDSSTQKETPLYVSKTSIKNLLNATGENGSQEREYTIKQPLSSGKTMIKLALETNNFDLLINLIVAFVKTHSSSTSIADSKHQDTDSFNNSFGENSLIALGDSPALQSPGGEDLPAKEETSSSASNGVTEDSSALQPSDRGDPSTREDIPSDALDAVTEALPAQKEVSNLTSKAIPTDPLMVSPETNPTDTSSVTQATARRRFKQKKPPKAVKRTIDLGNTPPSQIPSSNITQGDIAAAVKTTIANKMRNQLVEYLPVFLKNFPAEDRGGVVEMAYAKCEAMILEVQDDMQVFRYLPQPSQESDSAKSLAEQHIKTIENMLSQPEEYLQKSLPKEKGFFDSLFG